MAAVIRYRLLALKRHRERTNLKKEKKKAMNLTSLTALILTFHNVAALLMLIIALLISLLSYFIFLRRLPHKGQSLLLVLLLSLVIGWLLSERFFSEKPIKFELVRVG